MTDKTRFALLSVYSKSLNFDDLVNRLIKSGYSLIASGGTYKHVKTVLGLDVTHASEITGLKPVEGKENVLDHRVETLCPQLHGALLADEIKHTEELSKLGWPFIDMVVCTFYPLEKTMEEKSDDLEAINNQVDIGGPTLVRSACKGGRIVVVDENDFSWVISLLDHIDEFNSGGNIQVSDIEWLHAKAAAWITRYMATEAVFRHNKTRPL